jgi:hypothetical protein
MDIIALLLLAVFLLGAIGVQMTNKASTRRTGECSVSRCYGVTG